MRLTKHISTASLFIIGLVFTASAQLTRYPYIQQPTESSVVIAWQTAADESSMMVFGPDSVLLTDTLSSATPTKKHTFKLNGLESDKLYYYKVLSNTEQSSTEHFYTSRPITNQKTSFLLYGDCGYNNGIQNSLAERMSREKVDFAIVAGDVDQGLGNNYQNVFFGVYEDMLARDCHYTAIGNHDTYWDGAATYLEEFYLPHNNTDSSERYYSFTWGDCKLICLDSNIPYTSGSAQYNWLVDQLKCNEQRWVAVYFHHPPWTNAWDLSYYIPFQPFFQYEGNVDMRTELVPLFEQYGVDFVLNGHSHGYQRGYWNGIYYLISGGAGDATLDFHTNSNPQITVENYVNHYMRFDISADTAVFKAIDIDGNVIDSIKLIKSLPALSANPVVTDVSCNGASDGKILLNVGGPAPPYSLLWSNGDSTSLIAGLPGGVYNVQITDSGACVFNRSAEVHEPDSLTILISTSNPDCGLSNGTALASAQGGTPDYAWFWSSGSLLPLADSLSAGTVYVIVVDQNGCLGVDSAAVSDAGCCSIPNNLQAVAGTNQVTLSWDAVDSAVVYGILGGVSGGGGGGFVKSITPSKTIAGLSPGTIYIWSVAAACTHDTSGFSTTDTFQTTLMRSAEIAESSMGLSNDLYIYPNPGNDVVHVQWKGSGTIPVATPMNLQDANGKTLRRFELESGSGKLSVRGLSPGVYWLQPAIPGLINLILPTKIVVVADESPF